MVLRVRDAERSLRFYCDVLGCREERRSPQLGLIQLRAGTSLIDLVPLDSQLGKLGGAAPGREGRNVEHICLGIDPFEEEELRAHLARHGVAASPAGERYGAEGMGPSLYVRDPDDNVIELKGPGKNGSNGLDTRSAR